MLRFVLGEETLRGLSRPLFLETCAAGTRQTSENSRAPANGLDASRSQSAKEAAGDALPGFLPAYPGREKPMGASSIVRANHTHAARDSGEGQTPEAAAPRAGPPPRAARVTGREKRQVGPEARKRVCTSRGGERSEGRIPRALSARNRADPVWAGASRHEGDQTLKAERSGLGTPASGGSPKPACAEGKESP
jgi:hypothetical protein